MSRISVYVSPELHRRLKVAASEMGVSLSDFMVHAAERALHAPDRRDAARRMDAVRAIVTDRFTVPEILELRDTGRR